MPKLITVFSGKKSSGKSAAAKLTLAEFLNKRTSDGRFTVIKKGKEAHLLDNFENRIITTDYPNKEYNQLVDCYGAKIYSFADPLKEIAMNVLGLDSAQCYGSDDDKNSKTHIEWESLPEEMRNQYIKPKKGTGKPKPPKGFMTAREILEVVGTLVFRKMDNACWARALYKKINSEDMQLAIIADCRFPNEVSISHEHNAKVVRLLRNPYDSQSPAETALDEFPLGYYSLVFDNENDKSMTENHKILRKVIIGWLNSHNL